MLNLSTLKTPGVYIDEVSLLPASIPGVETSIPAFIGYTNKADDKSPDDLISKPQKITSLKEYESYFGKVGEKGIKVTINDKIDAAEALERNMTIDFTPAKRNMYYQMLMFFANGGSVCYIVSVGVGSIDTTPAISDLQKGLDEVAKLDEPTLIVFPDVFNGNTEANVTNLYQKALKQAGDLQDRFVIMDVETESGFRSGIGNLNLKYGAAYYPKLETLLPLDFNETDVTIEHKVIKGAAAATDGEYKGTLDKLKEKANALYGDIKQKINQKSIVLYPSSAIAGVYAAVDASRGVWKAPANVALANTLGPKVLINDLAQKDFNVDVNGGKSINVIRSITGRGPAVVWGARTLDGNDNEWRYVSVRRFFNFVEESIKKATYRFVFEPNDANTWVSVRGAIESFLTLQWRAGALMGAKTEDAFFVRVGLGQTMSADDIYNGRLIIEIGMAVVRPAEFIVLKFMHKVPQ